MSLTVLPANEALSRFDDFHTVIDARSEDEFAHDHLPLAVNWPTLNNEERQRIGTMYVQVNQFEAKKLGAAIAARNIAAHIEREVLNKPKDWKPLAYCWRGGKRSGALSLILDQIGFRVTLIEGGYKAFRAAMLLDLVRIISELDFRVVCGTTGSGKTRLLHALQRAGAQVLDLEGLANHRSSVLGAVPGVPQPTQKRFDTLLWNTLRKFNTTQPVYVESESKKVGNLSMPDCLTQRMRASPCLNLILTWEERVALLLEDYEFLTKDREYFCNRLDVLTQFLGKARITQWKGLVALGHFEPVVGELLKLHYDPGYLNSIQRNFSQFTQALEIRPADRSAQAMDTTARQLLQSA